MSTDLKTTLRNLPKFDLHRHLEGSIRPATIAGICKAHGVPLPTYDAGELASLVQLSGPVDDLGAFFEPFRIIKFCFVNREEIARITYEVIEDASLDGVEYVELRFSPEFMSFYHGLSMQEVMDGIVEGVAEAGRRFPTTAKLIVSISRHCSAEILGIPWPTPDEVVRLAVDYADRGVVGLDLSGRELGFPPELFIEHFKVARDAGLGITIHAGEDDGPASIRGAIEHLGATRIGHGVRIVQDPEVIRLAMDKGIVLEVCPTSNVLTHAVESFESHPVRQLYDMGLSVTINSDDPSVCSVTLSNEYALIIERYGFTLTDIERMIQISRSAAFA